MDRKYADVWQTVSSKLITSYALPPQSSFTCVPCSTKSRKSRKNGIERRTYISTSGSSSKVSLFRDSVAPDGTTTSSTTSHESVYKNNPVVFLQTVSSDVPKDLLDLLVVHKDGEIQCLDGTDLSLQWTSPSSSITKNEIQRSATPGTVVFCQIIDAYSATQGLFKNRADILASFPQPISQDGYNPDLLALILATSESSSRTFHILALPASNNSLPAGFQRSAQSIFATNLESKQAIGQAKLCYELHAASATLYENAGNALFIYNLTGGTSKLELEKRIPQHASILRLSAASLAVFSEKNVEIYNPRFGSTQASASLPCIFSGQKRKAGEMSDDLCQFLSFRKSQNVIHVIRGDQLLAFQIDVRQEGTREPRSLGLLVDSIGYGDSSGMLPLDANQQARIVEMDKHAAENNIEEFEGVMAKVLGIQRDETSLEEWQIKNKQQNELQKQLEDVAQPLPSWNIDLATVSTSIDNRMWIKYALQKIFAWSPTTTSDENPYQLCFQFFPPNLVDWLNRVGALTRATVEAALRSELLISNTHEIPAGQMVAAWMEIDPGMTSLLAFLSNNFLEAAEVACAVRALMESLELFGDETPQKQALVQWKDDAEIINSDAQAQLEDEEDAADDDIALAEFYLGDGADVRNQALKMAIVKLHAAPKKAAVQALKSTFSTTEIIAFIYLLRFELAKGSWTSRYLDVNEFVDEGSESQDSNIVLISDLLNTCIDAIGSGGWLDGNAMLAGGDQFESEELISSLSVEVGAALTGIEESAYLKNLLGQVIRYGEAMQYTQDFKSNKVDSSMPSGKLDLVRPKLGRPIILPQPGKNSAVLPFGMKAEQRISTEKIGAGGEVTRRTARDIGRLKSQKVGKYSRERIVV